MRRQKADGWFAPRTYSHFDYPQTFEQASALATNPLAVASHSFLPLISFTDVKRKFSTDNSDRSIPVRLRPRIAKEKLRDLRYASHRDAAVFSYYAYKLQDNYEKKLAAHKLEKCVIGYRSGLGSNIDLAADAFSDISSLGKACR